VVLWTHPQVLTCGRGSFGRQANGQKKDCTTPVYVNFEGGPWDALSVSAGGRHSIVTVRVRRRGTSICIDNKSPSQRHLVPLLSTDLLDAIGSYPDEETEVPLAATESVTRDSENE
jgi:hypothetical protein